MRRVERATLIANRAQYNALFKFGDLIIDPRHRLVTLNGKEIHFTPTEFSLLTTFAKHPHDVLKRETLLEEVWDWPDASGTRTVDSHVQSLRHKIGSSWIRTIHGIGYAFEPPDEDYDQIFN